jgi:hypothetical protein
MVIEHRLIVHRQTVLLLLCDKIRPIILTLLKIINIDSRGDINRHIHGCWMF